jgi:uncharacterized protein (DUF736 family)
MNGLKLTGLWKNTSKDGKAYLSGSLGGVKVLVFPNEHKRDEKDPDYNLVLTPREDKEKPAAAAPPSGSFPF